MTNQSNSKHFASQWKLMLRVVNFAWKANPVLLALALLTTVLSGISLPAQIWASKAVIDRLPGLSMARADWQKLAVPLLLFFVFWGLTQVSQSASGSVYELLASNLRYHGLREVVKKAAVIDIAHFDSAEFYDRLNRVKNEIWQLENITIQITGVISSVITTISLLVLLAQISWVYPVVLLLVTMPGSIVAQRLSTQQIEMRLALMSQQRMVAYLGSILGNRDSFKEIRLFGLEKFLLNRHQTRGEEYYRQIAAVTLNHEKKLVPFSALSILGVIGLWVWSCVLALARRISIGDVALIFQSVENSRRSLNGLFVELIRLSESMAYLDAFFGFVDAVPEESGGETKAEFGVIDYSSLFAGKIEFDHVSFSYPGEEKVVLQDISLTIEPGQTIALVGENGAGKTTLIKLLTGLYSPSQGKISVHDVNLKDVDSAQYYNEIGVLFQDYAHYDLSVRENIALGSIINFDDMTRIEKAAQLGGVSGVIEKLSNGFDTMLGKRFEGGIELSGGEWQKIAMARAFMRDAQLLILDEPTAALDAYSENDVYNRFSELTKGKTTIFVTHRLSSVKMAEKILVLQHGKLIEEGSHTELMEDNGVYAEMFNSQAERYQV